MKGKVIPTWVNKPLKVTDLLKICKNAVDNGLGDKYVFISQDDEGNYHRGFTERERVVIQNNIREFIDFRNGVIRNILVVF